MALSTGNYVLRGVRWHLYLRRLDLRVPVVESAAIFTAGFTMTVTPAKMGEVIKSALLKQSHGIRVSVSAPVVVAERVTDLAGLSLLAAIGSLAFESGWPFAIAGAGLVVALLIGCMWRPLGEGVLAVCERLPVVRRGAGKLRDAYESLVQLSSPVTALLATSLATAAWGLQCVALWWISGTIDAEAIDLLASLLAYPVPLLAGTLAMIPGGLGLTELSMAGALTALSGGRLSTADATLITLIVRLATFWWAIALGVGALAYWRVRHGSTDA